jgi:ABC-type transport system involved in multi-copper enzyme maturation permease subunit
MAGYVGRVGLYAALYTLVMMVIAVLIFEKKEV